MYSMVISKIIVVSKLKNMKLIEIKNNTPFWRQYFICTEALIGRM